MGKNLRNYHVANAMPYPFRAGYFLHYKSEQDNSPTTVHVIETPTLGRVCHSLKMGGTLQCGYSTWSGIFLLTRPPFPLP